MKSFFAPLTVVACLATSAYSQFTINSLLNVVVCQPSLITWVGGQAPYFLSILPANQPSANALVDLGQQNGNSVTWLANLGVGTSAFLNLRDSTGALAQSGTFTVLTGSNTTCVGQPISASQGAAATTAAPVPSPASATGSSTHAKTTGASASGSAPSAAHSSAALSKYANVGAAAIVGSALLALVV